MSRFPIVLLAFAIAGCSDDANSEDSEMDCIVREEIYDVDAEFDYELAENTAPLEECTPTCNQGAPPPNVDDFLSVVALPAGECDSEPSCDMSAYTPCPCPEDRGVVNEYRCRCENSEWTCVVISQGGATCPDQCPADEDGGR